MSKPKRSAKSNKSSRKSKAVKNSRKQRQTTPVEQPAVEAQPQSDCPYRPGTLYGTLFIEGNKDYIAKGDAWGRFRSRDRAKYL